MAKFGEQLLKLRERRKLSQKQVADSAGIDVSSIKHYEHGRRSPRADTAIKIAACLGTTVEKMMPSVKELRG